MESEGTESIGPQLLWSGFILVGLGIEFSFLLNLSKFYNAQWFLNVMNDQVGHDFRYLMSAYNRVRAPSHNGSITIHLPSRTLPESVQVTVRSG